ncbi:MAG TPA: hypothetical protein VIF57_19270 [Polyangia bacterium]|jgi:hypothetical protein
MTAFARAMLALTVVAAICASAACSPEGAIPRTFITKPRVLAIKAEPPSVAAGESTTVTILIVGVGGATPSVSWTRCRLAPRPGDTVNPDCVDTAQADFLEPIGEGTTITTAMPADVTADALGEPDASGGVYLPLIARIGVAGQTLLATYRLRLSTAGDVNHNPVLTGILLVDAAGGTTPIDPVNPPAVHRGDQLSLQAAVADGSVESYPAALGGGTTDEMLVTSWFSSAGQFTMERSDGAQPATLLDLGALVPASGGAIDLFAVTRDDRGGIDYVHRTLAFGQ